MIIAKLDDREIARTEHPILLEGNYYFPPTDVTATLSQSATNYTCPWKGFANYFDVDGAHDAAWVYKNPSAAAKEIAGYVAFDTAQVSVTKN